MIKRIRERLAALGIPTFTVSAGDDARLFWLIAALILAIGYLLILRPYDGRIAALAAQTDVYRADADCKERLAAQHDDLDGAQKRLTHALAGLDVGSAQAQSGDIDLSGNWHVTRSGDGLGDLDLTINNVGNSYVAQMVNGTLTASLVDHHITGSIVDGTVTSVVALDLSSDGGSFTGTVAMNGAKDATRWTGTRVLNAEFTDLEARFLDDVERIRRLHHVDLISHTAANVPMPAAPTGAAPSPAPCGAAKPLADVLMDVNGALIPIKMTMVLSGRAPDLLKTIADLSRSRVLMQLKGSTLTQQQNSAAANVANVVQATVDVQLYRVKLNRVQALAAPLPVPSPGVVAPATAAPAVSTSPQPRPTIGARQ